MNEVDTDHGRKITCVICGKVWPLFEGETANWVDYEGKVQCVTHCPELPPMKPNDNILKQLLRYTALKSKARKFAECPVCGKSFEVYEKKGYRTTTCSRGCSNVFFSRKRKCLKMHNTFDDTSMPKKPSIKEMEEIEKEFGDVI